MFKFFIFIFLTRLCFSYGTQPIPLEDKQKLEKFFRFIVTRTSLGYTLCGDKPCSIESYPLLSKTPLECSLNIFFNYSAYSILIQGWQVWSKYADYFPSNHFIFRHVPQYNTFILINKKATKKVIRENLDLFQKYSKLNLSAEDFFQEVCNPKDATKHYLIRYNITLLGILLGYGRNNSMAFSQRSYIQNLKKLSFDDSHQPLNAILNPSFVSIQNGTNERENNKIKENLQKAKKNIREQFKLGNYFETFVRIYQKS